jgi:hypothetical protein
MLAQSSTLRRQYGAQKDVISRSSGVPDRIIWVRECGPTPSNLSFPIAGISCGDSSMENVAIACRDTHKSYLCHVPQWIVTGK